MYNIFYVSLPKKEIGRKKQVNKVISQLEFQSNSEREKYENEIICDSAVYSWELDSSHLPCL